MLHLCCLNHFKCDLYPFKTDYLFGLVWIFKGPSVTYKATDNLIIQTLKYINCRWGALIRRRKSTQLHAFKSTIQHSEELAQFPSLQLHEKIDTLS